MGQSLLSNGVCKHNPYCPVSYQRTRLAWSVYLQILYLYMRPPQAALFFSYVELHQWGKATFVKKKKLRLGSTYHKVKVFDKIDKALLLQWINGDYVFGNVRHDWLHDFLSLASQVTIVVGQDFSNPDEFLSVCTHVISIAVQVTKDMFELQMLLLKKQQQQKPNNEQGTQTNRWIPGPSINIQKSKTMRKQTEQSHPETLGKDISGLGRKASFFFFLGNPRKQLVCWAKTLYCQREQAIFNT